MLHGSPLPATARRRHDRRMPSTSRNLGLRRAASYTRGRRHSAGRCISQDVPNASSVGNQLLVDSNTSALGTDDDTPNANGVGNPLLVKPDTSSLASVHQRVDHEQEVDHAQEVDNGGAWGYWHPSDWEGLHSISFARIVWRVLVFVVLVVSHTSHHEMLRHQAQLSISEGDVDAFNGTTLEEMGVLRRSARAVRRGTARPSHNATGNKVFFLQFPPLQKTSVLACEMYAFLSSLALVPAMRSAGLDNVDINGLRRLASTLDTQVARRIDTHDEKQEVNLHFAKEVKALKLKHTSVPLKSYAKQFKAPSKSKHH